MKVFGVLCSSNYKMFCLRHILLTLTAFLTILLCDEMISTVEENEELHQRERYSDSYKFWQAIFRHKRAPPTDDDGDDDDGDPLPPLPEPIPDDAECFLGPFKDVEHNPVRTPCGNAEPESILRRLYDLLSDNVCSTPSRGEGFAIELRLSQMTDNVVDLVLSRAKGQFLHGPLTSDDEEMLKSTYICNKHLEEYGYKWYKTNKPKFTARKGTKTIEKCSIGNYLKDLQHTPVIPANRGHAMNRLHSEAFLQYYNVLVPIGVPLCLEHSKDMASLANRLKEEKKAAKKDTDADSEGRPLRGTLSQRQGVRYFEYYGCSQGGTCSGQHPHGQHPDEPDKAESLSQECRDQDRIAAENRIREMRKAIRQLASVSGISRVHFSPASKPLSEIAPYTSYRKIVAARRLMQAIYQAFEPLCPANFEDKVLKRPAERFWKAHLQPELNNIFNQVADGFVQASSSVERMVILSLVATVFPYSQLESHIPGLTHYSYKRARFWAEMYGPGAMPPDKTAEEKHITKGWTREQVESFLNYITSPFIVTELPFGTLTMKTSQGKVTIPATVRNMRATRIVDQYLKYLQQTSQDHLKLSRTSLIKLLKVCTARQSKALAGIDYYTTLASESFDNLREIVQNLARLNANLQTAWSHDMTRALRESRQYLKTNFKLHLKMNSKVADHCFAQSLSDNSNNEFQEKCTDHVHDDNSLLCDSCERLKDILEEIKAVQLDTTYNKPTEKNYDTWLVNQAIEDIERYKSHITRGVYNELVKQEVLRKLAPNEVFITIDWAMKFLPRRAREGQSGWFGKRGLSWHIAVAVIKDDTGETYLTRTFVHVFEQAKQISSDVTAILDHIFPQIKEEQPHITSAIIRSDNAAHYKATATIVSIPELSKGPIVIRRWIFSEPQTGKGPADRAAARIKRHVYMYVDEGNDAVTAEQFVVAASSYGGLKDVSLFVGTVPLPAASTSKAKPSTIPGISKYYDFQFEVTNLNPFLGQLKAWRMPSFGDGHVIQQQYWLNHGNKDKFAATLERHEGADHKEPLKNYWKPVGQMYYPTNSLNEAEAETDAGVVETDETDDQTVVPVPPTDDADQADYEAANERILFDCPEPNCIRKYKFYGNLIRHIAGGNHQYRPERETMQDVAQRMFQKNLETIYTGPDEVHSTVQQEIDEDQVRTSQCVVSRSPMDRGWALREPTVNARFNLNQVSWLDEKFNEGKATRMKFQAGALSKQMPHVTKTGSTEPRFQPHEYLKETQIMSYFSRKARSEEAGPPPPKQSRTDQTIAEENDDQMEAVDPEDSTAFSYVRRDEYVTDPNYDIIEDEIYHEQILNKQN